jgi:hypothetical protein
MWLCMEAASSPEEQLTHWNAITPAPLGKGTPFGGSQCKHIRLCEKQHCKYECEADGGVVKMSVVDVDSQTSSPEHLPT